MQMGHDTENLVGEKGCEDYSGLILSPVNRYPDELNTNVQEFRKKGDFHIVLDPQLYFPRTERQKLLEHPYFPSDLDTADISSFGWWQDIVTNLSGYAASLNCDAICTPVVLPKVFSDEYYSVATEIGRQSAEQAYEYKLTALQSIIVDIQQLTDMNKVMTYASICSNNECVGYYLVLLIDSEPRREYSDADALFGAMCLVRELENTGKPVLVSNCSSDVLLYKAAGASHVATGKFFNLRRFTKSRFDEPSEGGGGQLAYWFENSLLAFLRQADLLRLRNNGYERLLGKLHSDGFWAQKILQQFAQAPDKPWVALGWRQYLSWFSRTEALLDQAVALETARQWTKEAEDAWKELEEDDIFMEERKNDGNWIRSWRQAISSFRKNSRMISTAH
jgi:hypothetical protein